VAKRIIGHAGLAEKVTFINAPSDQAIPKIRLNERGAFDLIFIDHWKDRYLPDLKLLETEGLIQKGTVLVADNVRSENFHRLWFCGIYSDLFNRFLH
jgi:catechol O-methyltransferase